MISLEMAFPCPDHPSGSLRLRLTGILFERSDGTPGPCPEKRCGKCGKRHPAPRFLKRGIERKHDGRTYLHLVDSLVCADCAPAESVRLFTDAGGSLRMRIELRDERGEPYRWRDVKTGRWRAFPQLGLRRLKPDGNVVSNQPYTDRKKGRSG